MKLIQILHHSVSPFVAADVDPVAYNSGWPTYYARAIRSRDRGIELESWRPERVLRHVHVWRDGEGVTHRIFPSLYLRFGYEVSAGLLEAVRRAARDPETCFLVHGSYNVHAYLLGPMLARTRAILQTHGGFPAPVLLRAGRRGWQRWVLRAQTPWERQALRCYPHILATSMQEKEDLERLIPGTRVSFSPVGLDFDLFSPDGPRVTAARGERVVLYVGRLSPEKGLDDLVAAFDAVARRVPEARLWIIGTGPLKAAVRARVAAAGLARRVRFVGFVPNAELPAWYRSAELAVISSLSEGFPVTGAEAMACGTPLVATRTGGTVDVVREFGCGVLVPPRDAGRLAEGILAVLTRAVGTAPDVARARDRLSWSHKLDHVFSIYDALRRPGESPQGRA